MKVLMAISLLWIFFSSIFLLSLYSYIHSFPAPVKGLLVGAEVNIDSIRSFNGRSPIFHNAPSITGNIHPGAKMIIFGVSRNGPLPRHEKPWEKDQSNGDHPGMRNAVR
jgi:hypothetical protein